MDLLAKEIGVDAKDILDYDLCMYNLDQPELVGFTEEFISAQDWMISLLYAL